MKYYGSVIPHALKILEGSFLRKLTSKAEKN